MSELDKLLDIFTRISREAGKSIGLSFFAEKRYIAQLKAIKTFPVFNDLEESVSAMKMLWDYSRKNQKKIHVFPGKKGHECKDTAENSGKKLIEKILIKGQTALSEYESKLLLASYQIPITREIQVMDEESQSEKPAWKMKISKK